MIFSEVEWECVEAMAEFGLLPEAITNEVRYGGNSPDHYRSGRGWTSVYLVGWTVGPVKRECKDDFLISLWEEFSLLRFLKEKDVQTYFQKVKEGWKEVSSGWKGEKIVAHPDWEGMSRSQKIKKNLNGTLKDYVFRLTTTEYKERIESGNPFLLSASEIDFVSIARMICRARHGTQEKATALVVAQPKLVELASPINGSMADAFGKLGL